MLTAYLQTVTKISPMHAIGQALVWIVTALFFVGLAGSAVVVLIRFVEDFRELFPNKN